jgi:hypothetical protein
MTQSEMRERSWPSDGFVNVYGTVESRPKNGTFDVYAVQPSLLDAINWYYQHKNQPMVRDVAEVDLVEVSGPDGASWIFDRDSNGGFVTVVRYIVPILERSEAPFRD